MLPPIDPVRGDETLPPRTSVVIIGGGIIGTTTALFLARKGIPVVLQGNRVNECVTNC